jgi:hypothetical protein
VVVEPEPGQWDDMPARGHRRARRRRGGSGPGALITRVDLIIVDDIEMLAVDENAAEGSYRLVDACYETRALAVLSNIYPAGINELTATTLATATVNRLLHHADISVTAGQSFRLAQSSNAGVTPLPASNAGVTPLPASNAGVTPLPASNARAQEGNAETPGQQRRLNLPSRHAPAGDTGRRVLRQPAIRDSSS